MQDNTVYMRNFLDDLAGDKPTGVWGIQKDSTGKSAIIRHHAWCGFTAYHRSQTNVFGSVYIGDGVRNLDLEQ